MTKIYSLPRRLWPFVARYSLGVGKYRAGKWLIPIGNAEVVSISTGGPTAAELTSSVCAIHESIQRDATLKSLQVYMGALEAASAYPPYLSIASANSFEFEYVQVDAVYKHLEDPKQTPSA